MDNYKQAEKAFRENLADCDPRRDPVAYNLYAGLLNLTVAIQADLQRIERLVEAVELRIVSRG